MTMRAGEVYEHPYERLVVRVGTAETDGRELVADLYVRADAPGVPRHIHPTVAETVTVIRGKVSAGSPDEGERTLGPGETLHVPPNTTHGWHPVGDEDVRMLVEARPGARFEEMWRQFMGLLQDGKAGPKGPGFLQIMMLAHEFSDVMAVAGPSHCRSSRFSTRHAPLPDARALHSRGSAAHSSIGGGGCAATYTPLPSHVRPSPSVAPLKFVANRAT